MNRMMIMALLLGPLGGVACGEQKADPPALSITLATKDGSSLVGAPLAKGLRMGTAFGNVALPFSLLSRVQLGKAEGEMTVEFKNQDRLSGTCLEESIGVNTAFGVQKVAIGFIREVRIHSAARLDGLLAYYPFDEAEDGLGRDASGNGRDGKSIGAGYVMEGKQGGACRVGRQSGHVQVPSDAAWNFKDQPFSIALWIKLEQMPFGEQMIVGHDEGGGEQNKWAFEFWQGNLCFHVNTPRSESFRIGATPWRGEVGRWHHLAVTRAGSDFRIYVDGVCVSEVQHPLPVPSAKVPLTMGQAERLFVEGALDEVMLFDRELSADEIQGLADR